MITMMTREAFNNMLLKEASRNYDNYGLVSQVGSGIGGRGHARRG